MTVFLRLFGIAFPVFLAIDGVWLGVIAPNFYRKHIGFLLREDVQWGAAILFYVIFLIGLVVFVLEPALQKQSWLHALLFGALFGFVTYATYDLTNLATVRDWPLIVTVVDLLWGAVLAGSVAAITTGIALRLNIGA